MCGIIGYHGPRTPEALELLTGCILQAARRGTHATGVAFLEDGELGIISEPISARDFFEMYDLSAIAPNEKTLAFVAHTRYSTSDLQWNQPLEDEDCALVLNGVISQHPPERWPLAALEPYKTGNDVEIALRYAKEGMRGEMPGSFAVLELWRDGRVFAYRNGDRPLYTAYTKGGTIFASTRDILERNGVYAVEMLRPGVVFQAPKFTRFSEFEVLEDTQPISRVNPQYRLRCQLT